MRVHRPRLVAPCVGAVVALLAAPGIAACGSDAGDDQGLRPTSTLTRALDHLADTDAIRESVEFGRPKAALAANAGSAGSGPYQRATGMGLGRLGNYSRLLPGVLGFDPTSADYAVTAGAPPRDGTLVSGLELGGLDAKARVLGATESHSGNATTYRFRKDDEVSVDDKLATALPGSVGLNIVSRDGRDLRYGRSTAVLDQMDASGSGLLGNDAVAGVATCLGDPLAAILTSKAPKPDPRLPASARPTPTPGVRVVGVGVSGAAGKTPVEQLCVAADSKDDAGRIRDSVEQALTSGTSVRAAQKWSQLLTDARVAVSGTVVSLTATAADDHGGLLLQGVLNSDLPGVGG